jgi:hypothetical protein
LRLVAASAALRGDKSRCHCSTAGVLFILHRAMNQQISI